MFSFNADLWRTLSPLLDRALELDEPGRQALLASLKRERPDVSRRLESLLNDYERLLASEFLESVDAIGEIPGPTLAGRTIGAYTLDIPLGVGGMGTVWRGHRSDGRFEGFVAIKLLNLALLDVGGDGRFRREGTLLARLAHPHIARLLDAGVTSGGQPFLVIEYVDGIRIDRFADQHNLDPLERLTLFLQVVEAVAHAHANLVIHRDLKPSNILVAADGSIKLLDFGVGRLIEDHAPPENTRTGAAARAFTPEYAAPEQVRGDTVTTATDIYALGVLLYVLLTGRHPTGEGSRTPADHVRTVTEREPVRASDAVRDGDRADTVERAARRRHTPDRLTRMFRGDVDNVLAKALEKDPARRYGSVTALADDLRRFLNHEPLSVRGTSWQHRAMKFMRRHRWPVAAGVAAIVMLAAGLLLVNRQRVIAESRFRQLRQLSQQVFELDRRIENLAGATDARQALVAASLGYLEGLNRDAGGDLDLMQEVSDGYWRVARIQGVPIGLSLGNLGKAEESLRQADGLLDQLLASRPGDRRALERSAMVAHDRMIVADSERRDDDALRHGRRAVIQMDRLVGAARPVGPERDSALELYANVAAAFVNLHRYEDAVRYSRRVIEIASLEPIQPRSISYGYTVLANARRLQGELTDALDAIREARRIAEQQTSYPNETMKMIARYPVLLREAFILGEDRSISLERPEQAAALLREAFEMHEAGARRDANDTTSRTRVGTTGRELGDILRWHDPLQAMAVYDVALVRLGEIRDNVKARRDRALVLANSSYALRLLGRTAEARRRVDESIAILADIGDYPADRVPPDSELLPVLQAQADQRAHEGGIAEALARYQELLQKVMAAGPDTASDLREAYSVSLLYEDLARLQRTSGHDAAAVVTDASRAALWRHWQQRHPENPFVLRQMAALRPDSSR